MFFLLMFALMIFLCFSRELFQAPPLPRAIADRLAAAPDYLSKIPKIVQDQIFRAHGTMVVALKPLLEVLAFYFSTEYYTLQEFLPEMAPIFATHKMMISQAIALIASAGLSE